MGAALVAEAASVTEAVEEEDEADEEALAGDEEALVEVEVEVEAEAEASGDEEVEEEVDEVEASSLGAAGVEVVAGEAKEATSQGRMSWWNHIGMKASLSVAERRMPLSQRIWSLENPYMGRRESLFQREMTKLSTEPGTPSVPSWQQQSWGV